MTVQEASMIVGVAEARDGPDPVDVYVGARLRMRRRVIGFSQGALAQALGLTFQQVQKYEHGTNRISASKLYAIARALGVPVNYFFEGLPATVDGTPVEEPGEQALRRLLFTSDGQELAVAVARIASPKKRRRITELVQAIADEDSRLS